DRVGEWIVGKTASGIALHEIGVIVRSESEIERAQKAVEQAACPFAILDRRMDIQPDRVSICTMHLAKGLEFRAVAVMACDDEVIPSLQRIETAADEADLEEVYNTERHLLYVACTRARDHLLVTGVEPASEFLEDLKQDRSRLLLPRVLCTM
ncbi:MAG: ATP-dependent helicase, partial [Desulfobacteraceae bacterium]